MGVSSVMNFYEGTRLSMTANSPRYRGRVRAKVMGYIDDFTCPSVALEGSYVSMIADEPEFYEKLGYKLVSFMPRNDKKVRPCVPT